MGSTHSKSRSKVVPFSTVEIVEPRGSNVHHTTSSSLSRGAPERFSIEAQKNEELVGSGRFLPFTDTYKPSSSSSFSRLPREDEPSLPSPTSLPNLPPSALLLSSSPAHDFSVSNTNGDSVARTDAAALLLLGDDMAEVGEVENRQLVEAKRKTLDTGEEYLSVRSGSFTRTLQGKTVIRDRDPGWTQCGSECRHRGTNLGHRHYRNHNHHQVESGHRWPCDPGESAFPPKVEMEEETNNKAEEQTEKMDRCKCETIFECRPFPTDISTANNSGAGRTSLHSCGHTHQANDSKNPWSGRRLEGGGRHLPNDEENSRAEWQKEPTRPLLALGQGESNGTSGGGRENGGEGKAIVKQTSSSSLMLPESCITRNGKSDFLEKSIKEENVVFYPDGHKEVKPAKMALAVAVAGQEEEVEYEYVVYSFSTDYNPSLSFSFSLPESGELWMNAGGEVEPHNNVDGGGGAWNTDQKAGDTQKRETAMALPPAAAGSFTCLRCAAVEAKKDSHSGDFDADVMQDASDSLSHCHWNNNNHDHYYGDSHPFKAPHHDSRRPCCFPPSPLYKKAVPILSPFNPMEEGTIIANATCLTATSTSPNHRHRHPNSPDRNRQRCTRCGRRALVLSDHALGSTTSPASFSPFSPLQLSVSPFHDSFTPLKALGRDAVEELWAKPRETGTRRKCVDALIKKESPDYYTHYHCCIPPLPRFLSSCRLETLQNPLPYCRCSPALPSLEHHHQHHGENSSQQVLRDASNSSFVPSVTTTSFSLPPVSPCAVLMAMNVEETTARLTCERGKEEKEEKQVESYNENELVIREGEAGEGEEKDDDECRKDRERVGEEKYKAEAGAAQATSPEMSMERQDNGDKTERNTNYEMKPPPCLPPPSLTTSLLLAPDFVPKIFSASHIPREKWITERKWCDSRTNDEEREEKGGVKKQIEKEKEELKEEKKKTHVNGKVDLPVDDDRHHNGFPDCHLYRIPHLLSERLVVSGRKSALENILAKEEDNENEEEQRVREQKENQDEEGMELVRDHFPFPSPPSAFAAFPSCTASSVNTMDPLPPFITNTLSLVSSSFLVRPLTAFFESHPEKMVDGEVKKEEQREEEEEEKEEDEEKEAGSVYSSSSSFSLSSCSAPRRCAPLVQEGTTGTTTGVVVEDKITTMKSAKHSGNCSQQKNMDAMNSLITQVGDFSLDSKETEVEEKEKIGNKNSTSRVVVATPPAMPVMKVVEEVHPIQRAPSLLCIRGTPPHPSPDPNYNNEAEKKENHLCPEGGTSSSPSSSSFCDMYVFVLHIMETMESEQRDWWITTEKEQREFLCMIGGGESMQKGGGTVRQESGSHTRLFRFHPVLSSSYCCSCCRTEQSVEGEDKSPTSAIMKENPRMTLTPSTLMVVAVPFSSSSSPATAAAGKHLVEKEEEVHLPEASSSTSSSSIPTTTTSTSTTTSVGLTRAGSSSSVAAAAGGVSFSTQPASPLFLCTPFPFSSPFPLQLEEVTPSMLRPVIFPDEKDRLALPLVPPPIPRRPRVTFPTTAASAATLTSSTGTRDNHNHNSSSPITSTNGAMLEHLHHSDDLRSCGIASENLTEKCGSDESHQGEDEEHKPHGPACGVSQLPNHDERRSGEEVSKEKKTNEVKVEEEEEGKKSSSSQSLLLKTRRDCACRSSSPLIHSSLKQTHTSPHIIMPSSSADFSSSSVSLSTYKECSKHLCISGDVPHGHDGVHPEGRHRDAQREEAEGGEIQKDCTNADSFFVAPALTSSFLPSVYPLPPPHLLPCSQEVCPSPIFLEETDKEKGLHEENEENECSFVAGTTFFPSSFSAPSPSFAVGIARWIAPPTPPSPSPCSTPTRITISSVFPAKDE